MRRYGPWLDSGIYPLACIPLAWAHLLIMSPYFIYQKMYAQRLVDNLFYILTSDGPYVYFRDTDDVCCSCCSSGADSAKINWVRSIGVLGCVLF